MTFSKSAHLYDALYTTDRDYEAQAAKIDRWIRERLPSARTLLDVACGTGLHLQALQELYDVTGIDVCEEMAEIARGRLPGALIHVGDMRDFQLMARFDAVICMFSSITYAGSMGGLRATAATLYEHVAPGGVCIVEPFIPAEAWVDGLLGLRTKREDDRVIAMVDMAQREGSEVRREIGYAVATSAGIELIRECHEFYVFSAADYIEAFNAAGFAVGFDPQGFDPSRGMYVLTRP
ncbi:MAG TPA: class I SAM-dependent methyltransferase [Acidimicrobiales bacterium]|jgi:SAM-dependent methyltransferase|nr:class I SAM-dependent methyltransferase [Acidimicrobiales bacterium]